jgi:hypothetical protein
LRLGFDGLKDLMGDARPDERAMVIFINRRMNSFKLVIDDHYMVYYRSKRRIPLDAIRHLPQNFGGTDLEVRGAIRKSLTSTLKQEWLTGHT